MLCFHTPTILEPQLITTFGANIKLNDSPIGYFGTGLKYAIASILRDGGSISIYTSDGATLTNYDFRVNQVSLRGVAVPMVMMDSYSGSADHADIKPCGFTTDLGRNWEPWMVYRELWSNTKDESGEVYDVAMTVEELTKEGTSIIVNWPALDTAHLQSADFLLLDDPSEATLIGGSVELYSGGSKVLFYRGIKVLELSPSSLYTWNLLGAQKLTEDRTLDSYTAGRTVAKALAMWDDQPTLEIILSADPKYWEHSLNFDSISELSPAFRAALQAVRDHEHANASARRSARSYYSDDFLPTPIPPTKAQAIVLMAARELLKSMGFPEFKTWHIGKDTSQWGEFASSKNTLFISPQELESKDFLTDLMAYVGNHGPNPDDRWVSNRVEKLFLAHWVTEMPFPHEELAQYLPEDHAPEEVPSEAILPAESPLDDSVPF